MTPPTIVAEISANHLGGLDRAIALIEAAKGAGADAVKLQCWAPGTMCIDPHYVIDAGPWKGQHLCALYDEAWTPWDWFPVLWQRAQNVGIEIFSSVFDVEALAFLESLNCPRYKIASFELVDLPLIAAVARTCKPIVLSTGMANEEQIFRAITAVDPNGYTKGQFGGITVLKCTSSYPSLAAGANLATMRDMDYLGNAIRVGVSDHSLGTTVPVVATALGATMIEKHLTLRRADGGPDAKFSSEPHEFKAMVDAVHEAAASIGEVRYGPTDEELPQLQFRRSLWWVADLAEGQTILPEHLQTARPALGLEPRFLDQLIGKPAKRATRCQTPVTKDWL